MNTIGDGGTIIFFCLWHRTHSSVAFGCLYLLKRHSCEFLTSHENLLETVTTTLVLRIRFNINMSIGMAIFTVNDVNTFSNHSMSNLRLPLRLTS